MRVNEVTSEKPVGNFPEMQHILQIASVAVACFRARQGRAPLLPTFDQNESRRDRRDPLCIQFWSTPNNRMDSARSHVRFGWTARVGKDFCDVAALVGAAMCSAC